MTEDHFIEATKALIVDRTKCVNKVMVLEKDPTAKFTNVK